MDSAAVRPQIATLVSKFAALSRQQKSAMNEQTIRLQFILPLFRLLGWDIEDPRDMSAEEQIARGFVDFGFYLNGVPAFYLETKRPGDSLDVLDYKRQAINYAYLKGVTWAVLTNFDEIRVFNAEWATDVHQAQFLTLRHDDYAERDFDDLWLLAKPAMQARELDRRAEKYGKKDKKKPVNKVLLEQLLDWRERLFRNIRLYPENQQLWATPHEIDNAIQKLFDRLIFLRSVEDRGIDGHLLKELLRGSKRADLFASLLKLFRDMNGVYNSNLFEDHTLDGLAIHDGELVYNLLDGLYYGAAEGKRFEYNFAAISADILGAVYEQYLGYKVQDPDPEAGGGRLLPDSAPAKRSKAAERTRAGDRAKKRKMQGIYYTPQYIVRYIVAGTVGRLLESGADPLTLRIVDPACGSGSFLIEAFDVLDRWLEKHKPELPEHERRRHILTHNLYGVDLDDQAVEVTRLNLTLRASLKREKLPMLHHIRCADSLRADWGDLFPDVIAAGGFDAVIGNPPYVRQETLGADFKTYAQAHYETYSGTADLYIYFIEKGVKLLRDGGMYGVIVANKWLRAAYGKPLRQWLKAESLQEIIDFGDLPVFQDATTYPCIVTVKRGKDGATVDATQIKTLDFDDLGEYVTANRYTVRRADLDDKGWSLAGGGAQDVLTKVKAAGISLKEYIGGDIYYGLKTGLNEAFVITDPVRKALIQQDAKSEQLIKPFLFGRGVKRYEELSPLHYLILIPSGWTDSKSGEAVDKWIWLLQNYPAVANYLASHKAKAEKRSDMGRYWWELRPCSYYQEFERPKIMFSEISTVGQFTLDISRNYVDTTAYILGSSSRYLLGVLNSKLVNFYFAHISSQIQGGFLRWKRQYVEQLPIVRLDMDDPAQKARHDEIVALVETMLRLKREHAELAALFTDRRAALERDMDTVDRKIDAAVYALYGLTPDEIKVVEGANA